jgi:hypothetical protein
VKIYYLIRKISARQVKMFDLKEDFLQLCFDPNIDIQSFRFQIYVIYIKLTIEQKKIKK